MNLVRTLWVCAAFCALLAPSPSLAGPFRQVPDAYGLGIDTSGSVATIAPLDYGWPGTKSFGLSGYSIRGQQRTAMRLEFFGGYASGLQAGYSAQRILKRRLGDVYMGAGGGLGVMGFNSSLTTWVGPYLFVEPVVGVQFDRRPLVFTGELYYSLALGPGLPFSDYLGRGGLRVGVAFGRTTPRNRPGPKVQQPTPGAGKGGPRRPPPPKGHRLSNPPTKTPPPPGSTTSQPPPPPKGSTTPPPPK